MEKITILVDINRSIEFVWKALTQAQNQQRSERVDVLGWSTFQVVVLLCHLQKRQVRPPPK